MLVKLDAWPKDLDKWFHTNLWQTIEKVARICGNDLDEPIELQPGAGILVERSPDGSLDLTVTAAPPNRPPTTHQS
jgi:hypothetical protein